ncbi:MAG: PIN domain-containing protein [Deltaproteobacteria bacterium]|nr:PIN domain-containing protein [Deltaproteobacteria bacterium]
MIGIDTNILVYAHRSSCSEHRESQKIIEKAAANPQGWGVALASFVEFFSVITHPSAERPSTQHEAKEFIENLQNDVGLQMWYPHQGFSQRLVQLASDLEIVGYRLFDLQIGLTCFENGASRLWSHDKNFVKIPGLKVIDPLKH